MKGSPVRVRASASVGFRRRGEPPSRDEAPALSTRWPDIGALPRTPVAASEWQVAKRLAAAGVVAVETSVAAGEFLSDWSELLEVSTEVVGQQVPLAALAASTEQFLRARQGSG